MLPEINPDDFSKIVCCYELRGPGNHHPRLGLLDLLLGCIAKALQVKVRASGNGNGRGTKQISLREALIKDNFDKSNVYWFLHGKSDNQLAATVVKLIKDMSEVCFIVISKF